MKIKQKRNSGNKYTAFWLLTKKIRIPCITVLLTGKQFIYLLPAMELFTKLTDGLIWFNKSRDLDIYNIEVMVMSRFSDLTDEDRYKKNNWFANE